MGAITLAGALALLAEDSQNWTFDRAAGFDWMNSHFTNEIGAVAGTRLEGRNRMGGLRYMWAEPEWTQSDIEAREAAFRQEKNIPASVAVCAIGWQTKQNDHAKQRRAARST